VSAVLFKRCIDSHTLGVAAATAPPLHAPPRPICTSNPADACDGHGHGHGATAPEILSAKLEIGAAAHSSGSGYTARGWSGGWVAD
jgi:hypothetical protein